MSQQEWLNMAQIICLVRNPVDHADDLTDQQLADSERACDAFIRVLSQFFNYTT